LAYWLTYSGRLTHKVIIRPASSQVQDRESSQVKDQCSTTVLRRQLEEATHKSRISTLFLCDFLKLIWRFEMSVLLFSLKIFHDFSMTMTSKDHFP